MARTYYQVLGLSQSATADEIKTAYKKEALRWHPDRNKSKDARSRFQEISNAYDVLSDYNKRRNYDESLKFGTSYAGSSSSADDLFGSVFEDNIAEEMAGGASRYAFWKTLGLVAGAALGFIVANIPGALIGATAGGAVGSVRDRTGKPALESFKELPQGEKMRILTSLAAKLYGSSFSFEK